MAFRSMSSGFDQQFPILLVVHDFEARSPDELSLKKGDRVDLIEKDDDFGDGWYLGRHKTNGNTGLFPEVYTTPVPRTQQSGLGAGLNGRNDQRPPPGVSGPGKTTRFGADNAAPPPLYTVNSTQSTGAPPSVASHNPAVSHTSHGRALSKLSSIGASQNQESPVMNETLSVIDEHITDMGTPRHSFIAAELRDSGSEYSGQPDNRISYIPGHETDEEEEQPHTRKEVLSWNPSQVSQYLSSCGVEPRSCEVLREQEISGEVLLDLDRSTLLMPEFDLGKLGPRLYVWQKIKSLQAEVASVVHSRQSSVNVTQNEEPLTNERIRSISQSQTADTASVNSIPTTNAAPLPSPSHSPLPLNTIKHSPTVSNRPSAASIRDLNHSRRHSSTDFAAPGHSLNNRESRDKSSRATISAHRKGSSFDRGWTLSSAGAEISRPNSSDTPVFGKTAISGRKSPEQIALTAEDVLVSSPVALENDRGYFSGGEVDNRKNRNVLRKRDTLSRSKPASYADEQRRRSATASIRQSRVGSADQALGIASETASKSASPNSSVLFRGSSLREVRAALGASPKYQTTLASPTVTKLEHDTVDSNVTSPRSKQSSTFGSPNPQSPTKATGAFSKARALGLRAISDAVTSGEKAAASGATPDSPLLSPSGTGSSTPNKSLDIDQSSSSTKASSLQTNGRPLRNPTRRKKSKKDTSAYRRGLMEKSPQEQMVGCEYSGWMKKKSSKFMTLWKPRLFILRGRRLSYYYSENDTKEQGLIDISGYRVIAAVNDRVAGLHATLTGAAASPASPENATTPTLASQEASTDSGDGLFIFKLSPPRPGYAGTNFTQPEEHYFMCDNASQGRAWMTVLMKVTIDLDTSAPVTTTYNQATISLAKAQAQKHRPPALKEGDDGEEESVSEGQSEKPIEVESEVKQEADKAPATEAEAKSEDVDTDSGLRIDLGS